MFALLRSPRHQFALSHLNLASQAVLEPVVTPGQIFPHQPSTLSHTYSIVSSTCLDMLQPGLQGAGLQSGGSSHSQPGGTLLCLKPPTAEAASPKGRALPLLGLLVLPLPCLDIGL